MEELSEIKTDPVVIYSSYTDAQKRATKKYREANREKVNEQRKKYYESRKEKDPDFLQYKRDKAKEYYIKKKESKNIDSENIELVKIDEPVVVDEPVVDELTPILDWSTPNLKLEDEPVEDELEPDLAWSKSNLKLEDLQDIQLTEPIVPATPKVYKPRKLRTKKEVKDLIESV